MPHSIAAYDRLWNAVRAELGFGPETLTRDGDLWRHWQSDELLVSQTCGLPYRARLSGQVTLVGTPDYGLRDCPPGHYFSYIIQRRGEKRPLRDLARNGRLAFNDPLSQSGWAAPLAHLVTLGMHPKFKIETGAHLESARAVLEGRADYAAIDAVTYTMWNRAEPETIAALEAFVRTAPTPGLPLITADHRDPEPIARAITQAIHKMSPEDRDILHLRGLVDIDQDAYRALPIPPMP